MLPPLSSPGPHHPCCLPPLSAPFCALPGHAPTLFSPQFPSCPSRSRPRPEDWHSSSDSDYEHYDFRTQPPVALTTFYSECLGPTPRGAPPARSRERGPAGWGTAVSSPQ